MDAKKILILRERIGWSQAQMAKAIGSSKIIISHWETELKTPSGITSRFLSLLHSLSDPELKKLTKRLETLAKEESDV
jgi:DNA-binding transcriptional regulator YiaG